MGLPQEVIERIMDMLQDNRRALKACSLTCKAMFASSRRLIHQTLHLTWETNQKILTPAEKKRYAEENPRELRLRLLSFMGERDLLKYARHLNIHMEMRFSLRAPEPHLQHLQSFDRIHTLTIHRYYAYPWREGENPLFTHFYPTLTTLVLNCPISRSHHVLQFALQFPNLQNLTLESLWEETWPSSVPPVVGQSPPLRGHFRCAGLSSTHPVWPRKFALDLPNGINFSSVEFQNVCWEQGQQILDGCASSLEEFAIHIAEDGEKMLPPPFAQPKLNVVIPISRSSRTGPTQIPGEHIPPLHHTPYPISQPIEAGIVIPVRESLYQHISRFLRVRTRVR
jgi:hypothetical protein